MVSPKIGPSFFGKNYEKYVSELTTEGTIAGENLTPEERKEGFKTKSDKIDFKNFLEKVLERLPPDAQKKITEGEINRVNFDRYANKISVDDIKKDTAVGVGTLNRDIGSESNNTVATKSPISPEQLFNFDEVVLEPEQISTATVKSTNSDKLTSSIAKAIEPEVLASSIAKAIEPEVLASSVVKTIEPEVLTSSIENIVKTIEPEVLTSSIENIVKTIEPEQISTAIVKSTDSDKLSSSIVKAIEPEVLTSEITKVIDEETEEKIPDDLDDLLKDIRETKEEKQDDVKVSKDDKILTNIKETNKNLLETNETLYGLIKSLEKEMIEDKKREFKEKKRKKKEKRKLSFASAGTGKALSGPKLKGLKISSGGLFDNPLFKFLGLSALAGLVKFIPAIIEFIETLPERIEKFIKKDIPEFIGNKFTELRKFLGEKFSEIGTTISEKFNEFKTFVGGFFTDRFNEVKQFFEDIYTKIDDFTGGKLTEFIEGIKGLGPMIVEKSKEFYKTVDDWTGGKISGAFDWIGKNVIDPLGNFFKEKIDFVGTKAGELWSNFSSSFLNFFGDIKFELPDLGVTELTSNVLGLEPAIEGPDLTQDLVAVGGTTAAIVAPISGAKGMAVEGMDASQVATQIPKMDVGGKSVQLGTGLSQGGTSEDVQKQIGGLREGGAKGVQVLGTGNDEKDATLQDIVSQNKDFATFLPAVKSDTGGIDYQATATASTQQIQDNAEMRTIGPGDPNSAQSKTAREVVSSMGFTQPDFDTFKGVVAQIESGGKYDIKGGSGDHYDGRYQLGAEAKTDAARYLNVPNPGHTPESRQRFREDSEMQERFFAAFTKANHTYLMGNPEYRDATSKRKLQILGYAHNQGMGGAEKWMTTGEVGADGFGTKGTKYTDEIRKAFAQQKRPERSAQPVTTSLLTTLDKVDSGGHKKLPPDVRPTSSAIPKNESGYSGKIKYFSSNGGGNKELVAGQNYNYGDLRAHHDSTMRANGIPKDYTLLHGRDINNSPNAEIPTPLNGKVTGYGVLPGAEGYGKAVELETASGGMLFAHLSKLGSFKEGDVIKAGTIIGTQGSTGGDYVDHLHLDASQNGHEAFVNYITGGKPMYRVGVTPKSDIRSGVTPSQPAANVAPSQRKDKVADALSKTPSRASRSRVSNINLPAEVRNNPVLAGSSGGESSSGENYVPRVSTRTSSDIYQINTRSLFNIVG